jgi:outer membrane protein
VVTQTTDATTGEVTTLVNPYNGPYEDALNRAFDGRYYSYSAGVTLEIPIGNAQAKADYARSRIDLESSQRQLQQEQESVTLEVKSAVTSLLSDLKSIEATRIARQLAEENVRNQQARYDVGLATTKDLLDFQNQLTQAQAAEVQSLTGYNVDLARLRLAEGTLLESRNVVIDKGEDVPTPWWAHF